MTTREWVTRRLRQMALDTPITDAGKRAQAAAMAELEQVLVTLPDMKVVGVIGPDCPYGESVAR